MIDPTTSLGTLVNEGPDRARTLERFGLDYCCGGDRSLGDACAAAGVDVAEVTSALEQTPATGPADWASMDNAELAAHIIDTHHRYLWDELPRIAALAAKVTGVHGANHPELVEIRDTFTALRADLEPHLMKEERILFPAIAQLAASDGRAQFGFGTVANPIGMMLREHDTAGDLLLKLRTLTDGYTVPADGCASYQAYFAGLEQVETDTHEHIHKENNTLFPRVIEQERAGTGG